MDEQVNGIMNLDGKLLFEVKLKPNYTESVYSSYSDLALDNWFIQFLLFLLTLFVRRLAKRGYLVPATLLLITVFFLGVRITDLEYGWYNHQFSLEIFSPCYLC